MKRKELIILLESVKYCRIKSVNKIRYSELRSISNSRLTVLTEGKEVDFGGNFEFFIQKFETEYLHYIELIKRIKEKGKTFIIPNTKKIEILFEKLKLNYLFEEKALVQDPIFIEYYDSYFPPDITEEEPPEVRKEGKVEEDRRGEQEHKDSEQEEEEGEGEALIDETGWPRLLIDLVDPKGVYVARYYYKNGHPVFLKPEEQTNSSHPHIGNVDPEPFYKKSNFLFQKISQKSCLNSQDSPIFAFDPWTIRIEQSHQEKDIRLNEENLQRLLKIGKDIAIKKPNRSFKIILEYKESSNE